MDTPLVSAYLTHDIYLPEKLGVIQARSIPRAQRYIVKKWLRKHPEYSPGYETVPETASCGRVFIKSHTIVLVKLEIIIREREDIEKLFAS